MEGNTLEGASVSMASSPGSFIALSLKSARELRTGDFYVSHLKSMHLDTRVLENSILKLEKCFHALSCLFMPFELQFLDSVYMSVKPVGPFP